VELKGQPAVALLSSDCIAPCMHCEFGHFAGEVRHAPVGAAAVTAGWRSGIGKNYSKRGVWTALRCPS
jgi:hypothetical protein